MQDFNNSLVNALELPQSCRKMSVCCGTWLLIHSPETCVLHTSLHIEDDNWAEVWKKILVYLWRQTQLAPNLNILDMLISCKVMAWLLASPGNLQAWHWQWKFIMWPDVTWYCGQHYSNWFKTETRVCIHKRYLFLKGELWAVCPEELGEIWALYMPVLL